MSVVPFVRSELIYKTQARESVGLASTGLVEKVQSGIDAIVEYPGSKKGEFGQWRLTDWLDGKIKQITSHGGTERV